MDPAGVKKIIESIQPPAVRNRLLSTLQLAVNLVPVPQDGKDESAQALPVAASKFGGLPDLPPGFAWPLSGLRRKPDFRDGSTGYPDYQYHQAPLVFLAQINLADTPAGLTSEAAPAWLLPRAGLLSFFAACYKTGFPDTGCHPGDWLVVYTPPGQRIAAAQPPVVSAEFAAAAEEDGVEELDSDTRRMILPQRAMHLQLTATPRWAEMYGSGVAINDDCMHLRHAVLLHVLGGHACHKQAPVEDTAADLPRNLDEQVVQLLQLDTDHRSGTHWCYSARAHFMIKRSALRRLAFDEVVVVSQI
ncbi:MAG TPA: YwqG family protein [Prosthecobacter sp.]